VLLRYARRSRQTVATDRHTDTPIAILQYVVSDLGRRTSYRPAAFQNLLQGLF